MKEQQNELGNDREQLLQHMHTYEQKLSDCSLVEFSNLRFQLKQVKEKLRLLNQLSRIK